MSTLLFIALSLLFCGALAQTNGNLTLQLLSDYPAGSSCLDGSPYGYYLRPGNESSKWIIHHQGGGWCYNLEECAQRALTVLGTSKLWTPTTYSWGGLLSYEASQNPNFYNWTVAILYYCDGSSFSSWRDEPLTSGSQKVYFRGHGNLLAASNDMLAKGLAKATDVIITGCSAGGLSTYLHLDYWRSIIPSAATVKGVADAGWFLDTNSVYGHSIYTPEMTTAWDLFNNTAGVNQGCIAQYTASNETWRCFFAEYTYPHIQTPIFMVNSKYDSWQIPNIYALPCYSNLKNCNATELNQLLQYGQTFLSTLTAIQASSQDGIWVDPCYQHCQTIGTYWNQVTVPLADGTLISGYEAFSSWYYGKPAIQAIDTCDYPCNPTCG
jgi:hypothetical protein